MPENWSTDTTRVIKIAKKGKKKQLETYWNLNQGPSHYTPKALTIQPLLQYISWLSTGLYLCVAL